MSRLSVALCAALALAATACAQPASLPAASAAQAPTAFDPQPIIDARLAEFAREDAAAMPPPGGIVLVGSSIFHFWADAPRQLAPLPVFNRAIGGTHTANQLALIEATALQYNPAVIVYYCGSNDLNAGITPAAILANIVAYADRVRARLPATRILFVAINRAPQKRDRWHDVDEANRLVQAYVAAHPGRLHYTDVNPAIEAAPYVSRDDLYLPDRLHFRPVAYEGFAAILKPVLTSLYATRSLARAAASAQGE